MNYKKLAEIAVDSKSKAYAKYSNFHVGAALLTESNNVYVGANIENASFGLTICAERTAAFKAVIDGEKNFKAIAIASDSDDFCPPCGACRQVLIELCGPELEVIMVKPNLEYKSVKLKELIPYSFTEEKLKK